MSNIAQGGRLVSMGGINRPIPVSVVGNRRYGKSRRRRSKRRRSKRRRSKKSKNKLRLRN